MAQNENKSENGELHYTKTLHTFKPLSEQVRSVSENSYNAAAAAVSRKHSGNNIPESRNNQYSSDESSDSPLDFSVRRKGGENHHESFGRDSPSSPSSTVETSSFGDERKSTDHEDLPFCQGSLQNGESPEQKPELGEIRSSGSPGSNPGLERMISAFNMGLMSPTSMLSMFPGMHALMDPRIHHANLTKSSRPFKAYPKDPLAVPFGAYGLSPGLTPNQHFDPALLQSLGMSGEDIMALYKRQMGFLKDRNAYNDLQGKQHIARSPPSSSSSFMSPSASSTVSSSIPISHIPTVQSNKGSSTYSNGSTSSVDSSASSSSSATAMTSSGRKRPKTLPDEQKDDAYWERRRKNNEAAKRSRDARRAKEDEIAIKAALLEQENLKLRVEVAALKTETAKLRCMLYNS